MVLGASLDRTAVTVLPVLANGYILSAQFNNYSKLTDCTLRYGHDY